TPPDRFRSKAKTTAFRFRFGTRHALNIEMSNGPNPSIALPKAFDEAEYINVRARAEFFGYATPTALAILPANFNSANSKEALLNQSSAATLRKLWKQAGVTMTP